MGQGGILNPQRQHGELCLHDCRRAMQHLGGGIAFGMQAAGFLELERGFGGNGEGRTAAQNIGMAGAGQPV